MHRLSKWNNEIRLHLDSNTSKQAQQLTYRQPILLTYVQPMTYLFEFPVLFHVLRREWDDYTAMCGMTYYWNLTDEDVRAILAEQESPVQPTEEELAQIQDMQRQYAEYEDWERRFYASNDGDY